MDLSNISNFKNMFSDTGSSKKDIEETDHRSEITSTDFGTVDPGNSSSDKADIASTLESLTKALYSAIGGSKNSSMIRQISGFDLIGNNIYMPDIENSGITFFTRPKCNFTTTSLRNDRILSLLDTVEEDSIAFAIRCLLDTAYSVREDNTKKTEKSVFINTNNPFIPILSNQLKSISGWPDWVLETETSEGGFHCENITYPKGSDDLNRTYNLTANFQDIQGSFVLFLHMMWIRYMILATKGIVCQYPEDIENKRLGFTFSIYRFVLDTSKRFITKWSKATGCFMNSLPIGSYFNFDRHSPMLTIGSDLSIPITVAGKIEYMDWINLKEFNMLVEKFCPEISTWETAQIGPSSDASITKSIANHLCIPFIDTSGGMNELTWRYPSGDFYNGEQVIMDLHNKLKF